MSEATESQNPFIIWLTGIPGSGKSTIAKDLSLQLHSRGKQTFILDGDDLRNGISSDLGFSKSDRHENSRRVIEISKILLEAGINVIVALVSPYEIDRSKARKSFSENKFFEVFVDTPMEICQARDPKGHYKKALLGEIENFTGVDDPYEIPTNSDLSICGTGDISKNTSIILEAIL